MGDMVKIGAQVTPEFRRVLRQYCAKHGITIRELIILALTRHLPTPLCPPDKSNV